jgi:CDP-diacylglycerol--glycerol-3-phosphate 3-phosphatidyltransferase
VIAAITDWLDGYLARRLNQTSRFGAFLDPVADKLMVATALIMVLQDGPSPVLAIAVTVIIGREIAISALREWMSEIGRRRQVSVRGVGKIKTVVQMVALSFLVYREPIAGFPVEAVGLWLLCLAAVLTLWSMFVYLNAAWPSLRE